MIFRGNIETGAFILFPPLAPEVLRGRPLMFWMTLYAEGTVNFKMADYFKSTVIWRVFLMQDNAKTSLFPTNIN